MIRSAAALVLLASAGALLPGSAKADMTAVGELLGGNSFGQHFQYTTDVTGFFPLGYMFLGNTGGALFDVSNPNGILQGFTPSTWSQTSIVAPTTGFSVEAVGPTLNFGQTLDFDLWFSGPFPGGAYTSFDVILGFPPTPFPQPFEIIPVSYTPGPGGGWNIGPGIAGNFTIGSLRDQYGLIPAPGAALLGVIGMAMIAGLRRRFS